MTERAKYHVSVSAKTFERLKAHAEATGLSMAEIITAIVESLEITPEVTRDR